MVVRELTGGLYFGAKELGGRQRDATSAPTPASRSSGSSRWAFRLARRRSGRVVSVDKANVLATSKLWRRVVTELHEAGVPGDARSRHELVDSFAMNLATRPQAYDVILTENLFGDILSDLAAAVGGGLGLAPSASIGTEPPGIFEPVHGSAPDIAGQGEANPIAMILSVGLMFTHGLAPARRRPGDHRRRRRGAGGRHLHRRPDLRRPRLRHLGGRPGGVRSAHAPRDRRRGVRAKPLP